jgi:hypothetical protein
MQCPPRFAGHGYLFLATSKGTYHANSVNLAGAVKAGNNCESEFFPAVMAIATLGESTFYVANVEAMTVANHQNITGLGRKPGILIDCLMNGNSVVLAYPHIEGLTPWLVYEEAKAAAKAK